MEFELRLASTTDVEAIRELVADSVRGLAKGIYSDAQIELSIGSVFGVDNQLIEDGTYFVAEVAGRIVGCGGWSRRQTLFGASEYAESRDATLLDPASQPAKIRAFFVHPDAARKGIGRAILQRCEAEASAAGFTAAEMMATLPGIPFYELCGYEKDEYQNVNLPDGEAIVCVRMSKRLG
ncbi:MAG TPA: GNAT family N-acetyltransferase [Pyrinomonadaceae bacterium]